MSLPIRISAGYLKNQKIEAPQTSLTHPMSQRIRQAIFNMIGSVEDLNILDAFAGSGSFGFEAVSRGAKSVVMIEKEYKSIKAIRQTASSLKIKDKVDVINSDNKTYLLSAGIKFDLILVDPPYNALPSDLAFVIDYLREEGLLIVSIPKDSSDSLKKQFEKLDLLKEKNYGIVTILIYRKI